MPERGACLGCLAARLKGNMGLEAMLFPKTPTLVLCCFAGTLLSQELSQEQAARFSQSATTHTDAGIALAGRGDIDGALRELEHAVQLDSSSAEASYNLGATWIQKAKQAPGSGDYYAYLDKAFAALQRAYRLQSNLPQIHDLLGWLYQEIGDFAAAAGEFEQAVKAEPESAQAYSHLGTALARQEKYADAIKAFERAVQLNPKLDRAVLNLGSAIQVNGGQRAVLQERLMAVRQNPESGLARMLLGQAYLLNDQSAEAERELRRAIELIPDVATAHYYLGQSLHRTGKLPEALEQLSAAVKLSPDTTEFQMERATVLLKMGRLDDAVSTLRQLVARNPADGPAHYMLGRALQQDGHESEARDEFRQSADLNHAKHGLEQAGLLTANGIAELRAHRLTDAVAKLRKAVELKPDYPEAQFYLGVALAQSGDGAGAIPAFTAALERRPRSAEIHYNFGIALWQMGKPAQAIPEFRLAAELNPDDGLAQCALGKALLTRGEAKAGQEALERAHQLGACLPR